MVTSMTNWQLVRRWHGSYGGRRVDMEATERDLALFLDVLPAILAIKTMQDLVTPVPTLAASER